MDARFPFHVRVADFVGAVSKLALPLIGEDHFVCDQVPVPEPDVRALERELKPLLGRAECLFGPLAVRNILADR